MTYVGWEWLDIITLSSYFRVICFIKTRLADGFVGLECNIHMTFDPGPSLCSSSFFCDKEDYSEILWSEEEMK